MALKRNARAAVTIKTIAMFAIVAVSLYVTIVDWTKLNFEHLLVFKIIMFGISAIVFVGVLYDQATVTLWQTEWKSKGKDYREPCSCDKGDCVCATIPLALVVPGYMCCCHCILGMICGFDEFDKEYRNPFKYYGKLFLAFFDFLQTAVVLPLQFVVIFAIGETGNNVDVLVNSIAAYVFCNFDDVIVKAIFSTQNELDFEKFYGHAEDP